MPLIVSAFAAGPLFGLGLIVLAVASTLSSMALVAILPMLRLRTGTRLAWQAWCGALVTFLGTAVLFWR